MTFLRNFLFTLSAGKVDDEHDESFNDVAEYGQFPADMKINGIKQIDIYSNMLDIEDESDAYITGLTIHYDGVAKPVTHGIVGEIYKLASLTFDPKEHLLVGVFGRVKVSDNERANGRIGILGFVELDATTGTVEVRGPYGSPDKESTFWATFGPLVAFRGTKKDGIGITTLGFIKTLGNAPRILEENTNVILF